MALVYISTGLIIAIVSGLVIGKLKLERYVEDWVYEMQTAQIDADIPCPTFTDRIMMGKAALIWLSIQLYILIMPSEDLALVSGTVSI